MNENTQENTSKSILPRWWRKLPWQQKLQWPAMLMSVGVVIALLVALRPFFGATPRHTAPPPGYFAFTTNISSGEFLINNQRYSFTEKYPRNVYNFLSFPAQNGDNTIQLIAPPFQPITCIVQFPNYTILTTSTCKQSMFNTINIPETLQNLPSAMQAQAIQEIKSAPIGTNAVWSETAPAGSHILINGKVQAIQSPWLVTMSRQVNLKVLSFPQITDTGNTNYENNLWFASIGISDIWTYTSLDTKQMYQNIVAGRSVVVSISYTPTAIEGATISFVEVGPSQLSPLGDFEGWPYSCVELSTLWPSELPDIQQATTNAESGIYGCLFSIDFVSNASSVINTTKTKPQFLIKFGVLLAANVEAHTLFPQLPQASALEVQEAIQNNQCQLSPDGCFPSPI